MSADDGIYLHQFPDGWRVVHTQAIENIRHNADKSGYNQKVLNEYFEGSPVYKNEFHAWQYAKKLYERAVKQYGYVEYGIQEV